MVIAVPLVPSTAVDDAVNPPFAILLLGISKSRPSLDVTRTSVRAGVP